MVLCILYRTVSSRDLYPKGVFIGFFGFMHGLSLAEQRTETSSKDSGFKCLDGLKLLGSQEVQHFAHDLINSLPQEAKAASRQFRLESDRVSITHTGGNYLDIYVKKDDRIVSVDLSRPNKVATYKYEDKGVLALDPDYDSRSALLMAADSVRKHF